MRTKLTSLKNHLSTHRAAYTAAAATTVVVGVAAKLAVEWHEFLEEQNVFETLEV